MKKEIVLGIVKELGLEIKEQAAFYKIQGGGKIVYIAKSADVRRIDISGFTPTENHPGILQISDEDAKARKLGKVRAQVDFSAPEEHIIYAIRLVLTEVRVEVVRKDRLPLLIRRAKALKAQKSTIATA